jgi:hypothetical protein
MQYTSEITINLPRQRVIELFNSTDNLYKLQQGLKSFEHVSGEPGKDGAVSELVYEMGSRKVEMTETIVKANFPDEYDATYEAKNVWNLTESTFIDEGKQTRWVMENEFKMGGLMGLMSRLMPGQFKKQTLSDMNRFKEFAEKQGLSDSDQVNPHDQQ